MRRFILFPIIVFFVFFTGFYSGVIWQSRKEGNENIMPAAAGSKQPVESHHTDEDDELAKAMKDPEFKRIHDFLERGNPMQMNLETEEKGNEHEGRNPVRFVLPE